jgi:Ku protein
MSTKALAPAPQRASNSFTITFGVLNIPVSAYTGTEETRVSRREFLLDGDKPTDVAIGRSPVRKDTGEVVDSDQVVRMAEASTGAFVVLTDDEIADCTAPKGIGDIVTFVPVKDTNQYLATDVVQVRPKSTKGKADAAAEKAYALLLTTMKATKTVALIKVALRGPARYGLLDASGNLTFVRTADQVREARDLNTGFKFSDAELTLAKQLVEAVGIDTPVLTDDTAPAVKAYVEAKAKGVPAPVKAEAPAIPLDIMAALSASIDAKKASKKGKGAA